MLDIWEPRNQRSFSVYLEEHPDFLRAFPRDIMKSISDKKVCEGRVVGLNFLQWGAESRMRSFQWCLPFPYFLFPFSPKFNLCWPGPDLFVLEARMVQMTEVIWRSLTTVWLGEDRRLNLYWQQQIMKENNLWIFSLRPCRTCVSRGCFQVTILLFV